MELFTSRQQEVGIDIPFDVVVASTYERVYVRCGVSTLDALLAAGVPVMNSCGEGTCGSCETAILAERADHRDSIPDNKKMDENEFVHVRVSRLVTTTLTLDL